MHSGCACIPHCRLTLTLTLTLTPTLTLPLTLTPTPPQARKSDTKLRDMLRVPYATGNKIREAASSRLGVRG